MKHTKLVSRAPLLAVTGGSTFLTKMNFIVELVDRALSAGLLKSHGGAI